jgi:serine/threonine-protein kinase HipA
VDFEALFKLHADLPREGPGSDDTTLDAIGRLPPMSGTPRIFDLGCGPGKQTLVLARHFQTPIVALDFHDPFLAQLRQSAESQGLSHLVETRLGRMEELAEPLGSIDLIWIEGAIFIVGFAQGLRMWRPLLRDGGVLAASEAVWFTDSPPAEIKAYWDKWYPAITTIEGNRKIATECGYEAFDHFTLPRSTWWDEYYTPLAERVEMLRPQAEGDPALADVLEVADTEMDMHRRFGDSYGYAFFLMRKAD